MPYPPVDTASLPLRLYPAPAPSFQRQSRSTCGTSGRPANFARSTSGYPPPITSNPLPPPAMVLPAPRSRALSSISLPTSRVFRFCFNGFSRHKSMSDAGRQAVTATTHGPPLAVQEQPQQGRCKGRMAFGFTQNSSGCATARPISPAAKTFCRSEHYRARQRFAQHDASSASFGLSIISRFALARRRSKQGFRHVSASPPRLASIISSVFIMPPAVTNGCKSTRAIIAAN